MDNTAVKPLGDEFLDPQFGQDGWLKLVRGTQTFNLLRALKPALGGAGELWVAAANTADPAPAPYAFARLGRSGAPVLDWQEGYFVAGEHASCTDIQVLPDGRILVVGRSTAPGQKASPAVACYHPDGSLDLTYGNAGKTIIDLTRYAQAGHSACLAQSAVHQRSGIAYEVVSSLTSAQELLLGFSLEITGANGDVRSVVVRLTPSGQLDGDFGESGRLTLTLTQLGDPTNWLMDVLASQNGDITLLAFHEAPGMGIALARFTADGRPDYAFGDAGAVQLRADRAIPSFRALTPDGAERVKVSGAWSSGSSEPFTGNIIGVNGSGFDASFNGAIGAELAGVNVMWDSCATEPGAARHIVVAGSTQPPHKIAVARYEPDTSLDPEFGGGWFNLERTGLGSGVRCVVMPDRRIILGALVERNDSGPGHIELASLKPA